MAEITDKKHALGAERSPSEFEKGTVDVLPARAADSALTFLRRESAAGVLDVDEKTLVRKIDLMIIPYAYHGAFSSCLLPTDDQQ
jgi:hypothetical protein